MSNVYEAVIEEALGPEVVRALSRVTEGGRVFVSESGGRVRVGYTTGDVESAAAAIDSPLPVVLVDSRPATAEQYQSIVARLPGPGPWHDVDAHGVLDRGHLAREWLRLVPKTREKAAVKLVLRTFDLSVTEVQDLVREWRRKNGQGNSK